VNNLKHLNDASIFVSPAPTLTLNAMLQDSDTNILSSPRLRVRNREKAKIMIGERVPMITNTVTPTTTGGSVVTGTVTYQDVGLKLDVEPEIHLDNEVSIKIGLEVSSLGLAVNNSSGSQVFRVGTRNTSTVLRLRDGEMQILGGLITDEDRSTADKVPALGQIPLLGHLFSSDNGNKSKTEIVLSITPHIVGNFKLPDARGMEYWSGTEAALRSSPLDLKPFGAVSLGSSGTTSSATTVPRAAAPTPAFVPRTPLVAAPRTTIESAAQPPSIAQSVAQLSWQGPSQAKVGDKIMLSLNAQSTLGLKTFSFRVGFDPAVLQAVDVIEGDALKRNNTPSNLTKNIDQAGGEISVDLLGTGANVAASFATLIFEVIAAVPESSVSISSITTTGVTGEIPSPAAPEPYVISVSQ
jgi:general secretion pathway protein D